MDIFVSLRLNIFIQCIVSRGENNSQPFSIPLSIVASLCLSQQDWKPTLLYLTQFWLLGDKQAIGGKLTLWYKLSLPACLSPSNKYSSNNIDLLSIGLSTNSEMDYWNGTLDWTTAELLTLVYCFCWLYATYIININIL